MRQLTYPHHCKETIWCSVTLLLLLATLPAQSRQAGRSMQIRLEQAIAMPASDTAVAEWMRHRLQLPDLALQLLSQRKDPAGNTHYRYRQYRSGLPIAHSMVIAHFNAGRLYALSGSWFYDDTSPAPPQVGPDQARALALASVNARTYAWAVPGIAALSGSSSDSQAAALLCLLPDNESGRLKTAYRFDIFALDPLDRQFIYVDAQTGDILLREQRLHTADRKGTAHTRYSGTQDITCDSLYPGSFALQESGRGGGIATYNAGRNFFATTIPFTDDDNVWNNINADQDEIATDVHLGMEMAYDYYRDKFARNSYDAAGARIVGMVHAGNKYNNASWAGDFALFGDGDSLSYRPLVSPDICVHEFSHGVTQNSAELIYMDEMGALNESFSDIFAQCAMNYLMPAAANWQCGPAVQYNGKPMRDMADPHTTMHPKFYRGLYYYTGHADNGGVHTNSGVQNHWFYLLCAGGSGIRESDGEPFHVTAIGISKAEQIAYSTLTDYLFPLAQYKDAVAGSINAATALFGSGAPEVYAVKMAWYAVGLADKPVSIDDSPAMHLSCSLSPNPAQQRLYLHGLAEGVSYRLKVINLLGQVQQLPERISRPQVDISQLAPGIYILELQEGRKLFRQQFVKS